MVDILTRAAINGLHPVVALSRVDAARSRQLCDGGMDLARHGLRGLWHHWAGHRPLHTPCAPRRGAQVESHAHPQYAQWEREFLADRVRWPCFLERPRRTAASRIPPSQSSFPLLILTGLTKSNPASLSQAVVSLTE
jgi:hypothetical protein